MAEIGDLVLKGYFLSMEQGSTAKRIMLGFGSGSAENPVGLMEGGAVKVTQEVKGTGKLEGAAKRTAKAIGDELRVRFERQGWI